MQWRELRANPIYVDSFEAKSILASQLYKQGKLSLGQAADLVGLPKPAFAEILRRYELSIFGTEPSDLREDLQNTTGSL